MSEIPASERLPRTTITQLIEADVKNSVDYPDAPGEMPRFNPEIVGKLFGYINGHLGSKEIDAFSDKDSVTAEELLGVLSLYACAIDNPKRKDAEARLYILDKVIVPLLSSEDPKHSHRDYYRIANKANAGYANWRQEQGRPTEVTSKLVSTSDATFFGQFARFVKDCFVNDAYSQEDWDEINQQRASKHKIANPHLSSLRSPTAEIPESPKATSLLKPLTGKEPRHVLIVHTYTKLLDLSVDEFFGLVELLEPHKRPSPERASARIRVAGLLRSAFAEVPIGGKDNEFTFTTEEKRRITELTNDKEPMSLSRQIAQEYNRGFDKTAVANQMYFALDKYARYVAIMRERPGTEQPGTDPQ
jgi:hypothetical protein